MQEPFAQLIERTFSSAERTVIYRLIRSPRHVRHFTSDPIPMDTLQRILHAVGYGTSVGGRAAGQVILITLPALRTKIPSVVHASNAGVGSRRGLDTLIYNYNDVWGRLCELFPAPKVTFDEHDHPEQLG